MQNIEQQRESINKSISKMLSICASQLQKATEAFATYDSDLAEEVLRKENRVNALDIKIEEDCENYLALYNPVAVDLRFIMAVLKINSELERIADHAYGISKYVIELNKPIAPNLIKAVQFDKMYETLKSMLDNITLAYEQEDVKSSRKVFKMDKTLDKINAKSFIALETEIKKDINLISQSLIVFSVVKKYERVGDLIKNIAEEIIFYVDAEILKHKKKK